ncbi:hypothetical protein CK203_093407 [Vitis vinifera]|uniref:Uncharacterized protein n=1 Tax=Vitis vinifera TaxID=29760 RepID=A0A438EXB4_VITVI|nr:hypothetical protein CK203_093407 [Vitis vinifera]
MVDAEKRLLGHALEDPNNQHFVLLSDSCVPLHNFDYVYNYLMFTNISYIDCFEDPGPHGNGRYSDHMMPEVEVKDFRKGAQQIDCLEAVINHSQNPLIMWFSMKRQHAIIVMADSLYYTKFKLYCRPGMDGRNCYADEHYLPTLFNMIDPTGIANWSVTHVDWSEGKWHPKHTGVKTSAIDMSYHVTSNEKEHEKYHMFELLLQKKMMIQPCLWNGVKRPCYLFARKFYPEAQDNLLHLFSNYTTV